MQRIFLSLVIIMTLFCLSSYADDVIVADVNGAALTQKDLEAEVDRLIPQMTFHRDVSPEKRKGYYGIALQELINRELEYQDALAKGIKPDKEKIDAQMENFRKRFRTDEQYKAFLNNKGLTEEGRRATAEKDMLIESITAKEVIEPSRISEAELKDYYEKNISRFKQPESVRLRIFSTRDEKKAKDVLAKLKGGADFADLAYNQSEDPYRVKGGDIGFIHKGRAIPEIEDAAFKLKVGELSGLIKAGDYWYIIKIEEKKPEKQLSFEEVKGKLRNDLEARRAAELKKKWIDGMKAKSKIEVFLKTEAAPEAMAPLVPIHKQ